MTSICFLWVGSFIAGWPPPDDLGNHLGSPANPWRSVASRSSTARGSGPFRNRGQRRLELLRRCHTDRIVPTARCAARIAWRRDYSGQALIKGTAVL